jgi:hypothetical protein
VARQSDFCVVRLSQNVNVLGPNGTVSDDTGWSVTVSQRGSGTTV